MGDKFTMLFYNFFGYYWVHAYSCTCLCVHPRRTEECVRSSGIEVIDSYELPTVAIGNQILIFYKSSKYL